MSSQGTTDQKSQFLHFSSLSVSVFSPTFSPLFRCAECFSFCSNSPRLFLAAYVKCYHNFFCLLFCHVPRCSPSFFLSKVSVCAADLFVFCGEIVLNYAKAFVTFCFISLLYLFPHFCQSYSPFSGLNFHLGFAVNERRSIHF